MDYGPFWTMIRNFDTDYPLPFRGPGAHLSTSDFQDPPPAPPTLSSSGWMVQGLAGAPQLHMHFPLFRDDDSFSNTATFSNADVFRNLHGGALRVLDITCSSSRSKYRAPLPLDRSPYLRELKTPDFTFQLPRKLQAPLPSLTRPSMTAFPQTKAQWRAILSLVAAGVDPEELDLTGAQVEALWVRPRLPTHG